MNKYGSFINEKLIIVIISLVFLAIMFFFISSQFENSKVVNAENACSTVFSKASSSTIFEDSNTKLKDSFYRSVASACSSFSTTIKENEISKAGNQISTCWDMTNGDSDFLPSAYEGGVCMYCGDIKLEDYQYREFREDLKDELKRRDYDRLFETTSITSLNSLLLSSNAFSIDSNNNEFGIIMYSYKGEFSDMEDISNSAVAISDYIASSLAPGSISREFFDRSVGTFKKTQKGIAFIEYDEERGPLVNGAPLSSSFNCETIVPQKTIQN